VNRSSITFFPVESQSSKPAMGGPAAIAFIQHSLARYGFLFVRHSKVTIAPLKSGGSSMDVERAVRMIAGVLVLLSLALGYWVSP